MDMQNYTTPFANTGDREEFSIDTDPSGKVSLEKGWTELYQLRPEEGGLFILRKVFNQMMKLVSTDTVTWKTQTFPNWIDDKGDGLPFAYPKNAIVKYTNGNNYVSLVNNNTQVPTGVDWKLFDITALDNTVKLTGNQTIAGVKTFSLNPISTGEQSTAVNALTRKDYVDGLINDRIGLIDYGYVAKSYHIVAFGGVFNRADYPKLWAYLVANPTLVATESAWQVYVTQNDGICGFFSEGNGTTTFRVPNLDKAFLRPDSRGVGSYQNHAFQDHRHGLTLSNPIGASSGGSGSVIISATEPTGNTRNATTGNVATETRPRNIAVLPLIVAK